MAIGEPNTIFTKNLKGIKRRLSFSIIVLLIALILIILSLFLPWWSANFIHQSRHSSGIPNEDRDYNINFHLTETILENNYDKGTKDHIPHEKSDELETDYPDHLKNIFYMVISLIILAIVAFIFLLRFRFTLKNYWLIIALLIPIIIISFVTIFLFSGYTTDDNHVSDLWGESSVEIKYDSFQMSYQPGFGFFLIIIAAVYIMISLVSFLSIIFSANRRMIIKAHHPTKVNIRITQVSGIIIMVLVLFLLYFSFNTPWWTCNYSGEIDYPEDVTSIDFGWGPDKAYLIVEQGDTNELSPFDGHTYSEKSVHSEEFFSGDFKEGPPRGLIYEREKEVVSNTAYLVYIAMGMVLFSIIVSIYIVAKRIHIKWIIIMNFLIAIMIIIPLLYLSTALPRAYQDDMREPYIDNEYPIPSYSQAEVITGFSGEWEEDIPYAPWTEELQAQPEMYDSTIETSFHVHYTWGPSTGYFICIFAVILNFLGIVFFSISERKKKTIMGPINPSLQRNVEIQQTQQKIQNDKRTNLLSVKTIFLIMILLIVSFYPMLIDHSSSAMNINNNITNVEISTGPYKRFSPITSKGGIFADGWICGREYLLNLETGEKFMIPNYENKDTSENHLNGEVVVWRGDDFNNYESKSLLIYNLSTRTIDEIEMKNWANIEGITKDWLFLEIYNSSNWTYSLFYFESKKFMNITIPDDIELYPNHYPSSEFIVFDSGATGRDIYIFDVNKTVGKIISPPESHYTFRSVVHYKNYLYLIWRSSGTDGDTIIQYYDTVKNEIIHNSSIKHLNDPIFYNNGFIFYEDYYTNITEYYDLGSRQLVEWSIPFHLYFFNSLWYSGHGYQYNDKIYFVVWEKKNEDNIYHFNIHFSDNQYMFFSKFDIFWELDLNYDTDSDGTIDIYDDDDDNDGVGDYEDAYPYDSSKSEVTYKTPKYESLPPTELLALVILLIIVGIAIFSSKKIFKKPDHLQ